MDIPGWLKNMGLEQYEAVFHDNDIEGSVLYSLTNEDLKDIGVASVGHRRRLLDAIAVLREEESRAAAAHADVLRPGRIDAARFSFRSRRPNRMRKKSPYWSRYWV